MNMYKIVRMEFDGIMAVAFPHSLKRIVDFWKGDADGLGEGCGGG